MRACGLLPSLAGGVHWSEFVSADFRLKPAAPAAIGYTPPTVKSKGTSVSSLLDDLDSAEGAANPEASNPKYQRANALIPDIATRKSSAW